MSDKVECVKCGWTGTAAELVDDFGDTAEYSDYPDECSFCPECGSGSIEPEDYDDDWGYD